MAGTAEGARRTAAKRLGMTEAEYVSMQESGLKHCLLCREWHPIDHFAKDKSRADGMTAACRQSKNRKARERYTPSDAPPPRGRSFVAARSGDKRQARRRVNYLVDAGLLPNPNSVPCTDCGHLGSDKRHEYDHYLGYASQHHEDVQPVCSSCHHWRERHQ